MSDRRKSLVEQHFDELEADEKADESGSSGSGGIEEDEA